VKRYLSEMQLRVKYYVNKHLESKKEKIDIEKVQVYLKEIEKERAAEKKMIQKIVNTLRKSTKDSLTVDSFSKIFDYLHEQVEMLSQNKEQIDKMREEITGLLEKQ